MKLLNKATLYLGLGTLVFFGLGGILIVEYLQYQRFPDVLWRGISLHYQLLYGLLAGSVASGIAIFIITRDFFKEELAYYAGLVNRLELNWIGMVFLSLCAGIGEEIFFRAGIQPFLGIWWTAVIFVGLHGYLNPWNIGISIYGIVLVGVIVVFGYLFELVGIISAITAHFIYDLLLFLTMDRYRENEE